MVHQTTLAAADTIELGPIGAWITIGVLVLLAIGLAFREGYTRYSSKIRKELSKEFDDERAESKKALDAWAAQLYQWDQSVQAAEEGIPLKAAERVRWLLEREGVDAEKLDALTDLDWYNAMAAVQQRMLTYLMQTMHMLVDRREKCRLASQHTVDQPFMLYGDNILIYPLQDMTWEETLDSVSKSIHAIELEVAETSKQLNLTRQSIGWARESLKKLEDESQ